MEFVRKLVRTKSTKDIEDNLFSACGKEGNLKSVKASIKKLKQKKTNINTIIYSKGWTPLLLACLHNHKEIINFLIKEGMNINVKTTDGFTPLYYTVKNNNLKLAKFLINEGVNVNEKNIIEDTPLHYAFSDNIELDIIEFLIKEGADINAKNRNGNTPLDLAKHGKYKNIVEILKDEQTINKLFLVCEKGTLDTVKSIISELKQKGINIINIIKNELGNSLLHWACFNKQPTIVDWLIKNKIDIDIRNNNKETPLHVVCSLGYLKMAELLLTNRANVNAEDQFGNTPLHLACQNGDLEIAKLLIEKRADVNARNKKGDTSLHSASCTRKLSGNNSDNFQNRKKIIELLKGLKATNLNIKNEEGITAQTQVLKFFIQQNEHEPNNKRSSLILNSK